MLIDLRVGGRIVIFFGGGKTAERKVKKFLQHGAVIKILSRSFTDGILDLCKRGEVEVTEIDLGSEVRDFSEFMNEGCIVVAATDDPSLNAEISRVARENGILISAVDMPLISDFYFPAVAHKGGIWVGVCTDGKSPLMSKLLQQRFNGIITNEDILQVELQHYARKLVKEQVLESQRRREILYGIAGDEEIRRLLLQDELEEAKKLVRETIDRI